MNAINAYIALAFGLVCFLIGAFLSYVVTDHFAAKALSQAQADAAVAVSSVAATRTALTALKDKYADLQARHDAMRTLSETELAARQSRIDQLQADAVKRQTAIVEKSREPTCADLARLPVCPAVASQLWPAAAAPSGGEQTGNR
jgi:hypothetical protein